MLAKRLLELTAEYTNHEQDQATLSSIGLAPGRSKEEIAEEYERVLKELLAS